MRYNVGYVSGTVCFETCKMLIVLFTQVFFIGVTQTSFRSSAEVFLCTSAMLQVTQHLYNAARNIAYVSFHVLYKR